MNTNDIWMNWEKQMKEQRQEITEQSGCPMIRFIVDDTRVNLRKHRLNSVS